MPALVEADIVTKDEAKGLVLAHENVMRRALQEINAMLPELVAKGLLEPEGMEKLRRVVAKVTMDGMPDTY